MNKKKLIYAILPILLLTSCNKQSDRVPSLKSEDGYTGIVIDSYKITEVYNAKEKVSDSDYIYFSRDSYMVLEFEYSNKGEEVCTQIDVSFNIYDDVDTKIYEDSIERTLSAFLYPGDTAKDSITLYSYDNSYTFSSYIDYQIKDFELKNANHYPNATIYSTDNGLITINNLRKTFISEGTDKNQETYYLYRLDYTCEYTLPEEYVTEGLAFINLYLHIGDKVIDISTFLDNEDDVLSGKLCSLYFETSEKLSDDELKLDMRSVLTVSESRENAIIRSTLIIALLLVLACAPFVVLITIVILLIVKFKKKKKVK